MGLGLGSWVRVPQRAKAAVRAACVTAGSAIAQGGVRGSRVMMIEESEVKDRMKAQMDEPKVDAQTKRKKEEGCVSHCLGVCCGDCPGDT